MEPSELLLYTLSRIVHVGTAIVLVGGTFFVRYVLMPAATAELADDVHARLRAAIMGVWKKIVHGGIALFILSGGLNYYRVIAAGMHKGDPLYHALLGTKILLALVVFFIASALVGRSAAFEGLRKNAGRWLALNLLLAAIIVALSGFLKVRGVPPSRPAPSVSQAHSDGMNANERRSRINSIYFRPVSIRPFTASIMADSSVCHSGAIAPLSSNSTTIPRCPRETPTRTFAPGCFYGARGRSSNWFTIVLAQRDKTRDRSRCDVSWRRLVASAA